VEGEYRADDDPGRQGRRDDPFTNLPSIINSMVKIFV
jgi:hypothetical protein